MAWWLFQNLVVIAILAAVVALISRFTRLGPVARHALWVLVLIKFVTPPLVEWPWGMPDPLGLASVADADSRPNASAGLTSEPASQESSSSAPGKSALIDDPARARQDARNDRQPASPLSNIWMWLLAAWIAGSIILLAIEGTRLIRLARRVRSAAPAASEIEYRVAVLSARLGLRPVPVLVVPGVASPAVWCFGRPRLLWPAELPSDLSDACIDGLLVHELAHVQRRDHLVGWVELAAGIVWWWNPLFWYVRSALREQAELACDAWVISALPNGRRAYAESLLALSAEAIRGAPSMAVIAMRASSRRVLERRLVMIMKGRAPLRLPWIGLFTLAVMATATLPAWATSQQTPPPPPSVPVPVVEPAVMPLPQPGRAPRAAQARPASIPRVELPVEVRPEGPPPARALQGVPTGVPQGAPPPPPPAPARPAQGAKPPPPPPTAVPQVRPVERRSPPAQAIPADRARRVTLRETSDRLPGRANLPADGQALLDTYTKDRAAIQQDANQKMEARRSDLLKQLTGLQDKYTKAGMLDEALAIRNYIRSLGGAVEIRR